MHIHNGQYLTKRQPYRQRNSQSTDGDDAAWAFDELRLIFLPPLGEVTLLTFQCGHESGVFRDEQRRDTSTPRCDLFEVVVWQCVGRPAVCDPRDEHMRRMRRSGSLRRQWVRWTFRIYRPE